MTRITRYQRGLVSRIPARVPRWCGASAEHGIVPREGKPKPAGRASQGQFSHQQQAPNARASDDRTKLHRPVVSSPRPKLAKATRHLRLRTPLSLRQTAALFLSPSTLSGRRAGMMIASWWERQRANEESERKKRAKGAVADKHRRAHRYDGLTRGGCTKVCAPGPGSRFPPQSARTGASKHVQLTAPRSLGKMKKQSR